MLLRLDAISGTGDGVLEFDAGSSTGSGAVDRCALTGIASDCAMERSFSNILALAATSTSSSTSSMPSLEVLRVVELSLRPHRTSLKLNAMLLGIGLGSSLRPTTGNGGLSGDMGVMGTFWPPALGGLSGSRNVATRW